MIKPHKRFKMKKNLRGKEKNTTFATQNARMAESVDATVSNTVGATHPGSSPGPGTEKDQVINY